MEIKGWMIGCLIGLIILIIGYNYFFKKEDEQPSLEEFEGNDFEPSKTFQGYRKNKVFKLGEKGLGYYFDN